MPDVNIGTVYGRLKLDVSEWQAGLRKANQDLGKFENDYGRVMQSVRSGAVAMTAFGAAGAGVGLALVKAAAGMEQTSVAFGTLLKSGQAAQAMLSDLRDFAARTPFQFSEVTDAAKKIMALGFAAKDVIPTLTAVGDAASGLSLGAEGVNRIIVALGQMQMKGKVSAEEMQQLAEATIPAWDYLSKAIGKSTAETMKLAEKGIIPADKAIKALLTGMSGQFGGMMAKQAETALGKFSNLKDSVEKLAVSLGEPLLKPAKEAIGTLQGIADTLNKMPRSMQENLAGWGMWSTALIGGTGALTLVGLKIIEISNRARTLGAALGPYWAAAAVGGALGKWGSGTQNRYYEEYERRKAQTKREIAMDPKIVRIADRWRALRADEDRRPTPGGGLSSNDIERWRPEHSRSDAMMRLLNANGYTISPKGDIVRLPSNVYGPTRADVVRQGGSAQDGAGGGGFHFTVPSMAGSGGRRKAKKRNPADLINWSFEHTGTIAPDIEMADLALRPETLTERIRRENAALRDRLFRVGSTGIEAKMARPARDALANWWDYTGWRIENAQAPSFSLDGLRGLVGSVRGGLGALNEQRQWQRALAGIGAMPSAGNFGLATGLGLQSLALDSKIGNALASFRKGGAAARPSWWQRNGSAIQNGMQSAAGIYTGIQGIASGQGGAFGGAMSGMGVAGGITGLLKAAPAWLGPVGMGVGAIIGAIFGSSAEDERRHKEAQQKRDEMNRSLLRSEHHLEATVDIFRSMGMNLMPSSVTFGGGSLATQAAYGPRG